MLNVKKANLLKTQAQDMLGVAETLHGNANNLAGQTKGTSATHEEALKQKAGENDITAGTLRYLARLLYDAADALHEVAGTGDGNAASSLATEVGSDETSAPDKLRAKLKALADAEDSTLTGLADAVRTKYEDVEDKFGQVQEKNNSGAYVSQQEQYKAVEAAWKAFDKVYNANLKQLATNLKNITDDSSGLQGALTALRDATGDALIVENATKVIEKYNAVKDKLDKQLKLVMATFYLNSVNFNNLKEAAGDLSNKANQLHSAAGTLANQLQGADVQTARGKVNKLKEAASKSSPPTEKGLKQLLGELHGATGLSDVVSKAKLVIAKYNDVANKYNAVKDNPTASSQGTNFNNVTNKFNALQTDFKGQWNNISLIYTSRETSDHLTQIQTKADQLKETAETQSTSELASTQQTDLDSGNAQPKLGGKAGQLAKKAQALHDKANEIVTAATDPGSALQPLNDPAGLLKDAAKKDPSDGLYQAAEALANKAKSGGQAATDEADGVITAFETVDENYEALMKQAKEKNLTGEDKVTAVIKAYHDVKTTYYQMLIGYRFRYLIGNGSDEKILHKAKDLYGKANDLAEAKALQPTQGLQEDPQKDLKQELRGLAGKLKEAVGQSELVAGLQQALNDLKNAAEGNEQIVTNALKVIEKYNNVKDAYDKVKARENDYQTLARAEYPPVGLAFTALETKFGALQRSYENVLKLRVQELSNKSEDLSGKAFALCSGVSGLGDEANALAAAASNSGGTGQKGLKEKAEALVGAINAGDGGTDQQAGEVIKQFDEVTERYNDLAKQPKYKSVVEKIKKGETGLSGDDPNVKDVYGAYNNLKKLYDSILNFTKVKYYAEQLETAAGKLSDNNGGTSEHADNVINNYNTLETAYDTLPEDEQSKVKSEFNTVKHIYDRMLNVTKATQLQNEVGDKSGSRSDDRKMLYHADQLHGKAGALASDPGVSSRTDLTEPLEDLKDAIGKDEEEFGSLQKALSDLSSAGSANQDQKSKAIEVINAYTNVNFAFEEVKNLELKYIAALDRTDKQQPYTDVTSAFDALQSKYEDAISGYDPHFWKRLIIKYPSIVTQWLNFLTNVILWIVYVMGGEPTSYGCPAPGADAGSPKTVNSVNLAIAPGNIHTITLISGTDTGILTHTSKEAISLKNIATGTLIINIPGGAITLKELSISGNNKLIITHNSSKVSVAKKPDPFDTKKDVKINIKTATLNGSEKTLTLQKDGTGGSGVEEAQITGDQSVALDYSTGTSEITINGTANSGLRKYQPKLSPQYFDNKVSFAFQKWSTYPAGKFYLFLDILMVIKVTFAAIFIYSLHYKDSGLSRAIINQPKMSTFLSITFYMCHGSHGGHI